jgi:hypothetical protein
VAKLEYGELTPYSKIEQHMSQAWLDKRLVFSHAFDKWIDPRTQEAQGRSLNTLPPILADFSTEKPPETNKSPRHPQFSFPRMYWDPCHMLFNYTAEAIKTLDVSDQKYKVRKAQQTYSEWLQDLKIFFAINGCGNADYPALDPPELPYVQPIFETYYMSQLTMRILHHVFNVTPALDTYFHTTTEPVPTATNVTEATEKPDTWPHMEKLVAPEPDLNNLTISKNDENSGEGFTKGMFILFGVFLFWSLLCCSLCFGLVTRSTAKTFTEYNLTKAETQYLESLYKTPSTYSTDLGAAAFIQKHFPESKTAMNAVFHRPLADLQRMVLQAKSSSQHESPMIRKAESLPDLKPKCLCCEFNHEPKLYVI